MAPPGRACGGRASAFDDDADEEEEEEEEELELEVAVVVVPGRPPAAVLPPPGRLWFHARASSTNKAMPPPLIVEGFWSRG